VTGKLVSILSSFARASEQSLTEVAHSSNLPNSTAHRLLSELVRHRMLLRDEDGRYRTGLGLRMLSASGGHDTAAIEDRATPVLEDLSEVTGCRVRLGILVGDQVGYMEKQPDTSPVAGFRPTATLPARTSALGRTLLAYIPPAMADALIAHSLRNDLAGTTSEVDRCRRSLACIRARRLAINPGGEHRGNCCFASPVFGPGGQIVAAVGITVADPALTLKPLMSVLSIASRSLSRELADASSARSKSNGHPRSPRPAIPPPSGSTVRRLP